MYKLNLHLKNISTSYTFVAGFSLVANNTGAIEIALRVCAGTAVFAHGISVIVVGGAFVHIYGGRKIRMFAILIKLKPPIQTFDSKFLQLKRLLFFLNTPHNRYEKKHRYGIRIRL